MSYGLTFESVSATPSPTFKIFPWGKILNASTDHYSFYRVEIKAGERTGLTAIFGSSSAFFVEQGTGHFWITKTNEVLESLLSAKKIYSLENFDTFSIAAQSDIILYVFGEKDLQLRTFFSNTEHSTSATKTSIKDWGNSTSDFREKYWGSIETIVSQNYAGKRIFLKRGGQSSLEFHTQKFETYYVHSGLLKVGLRVGRGENRSVLVEPGKLFHIMPGLMHMRMALEDTLLFEASTRDSDADSFLVEDGQKYQHLEITPAST